MPGGLVTWENTLPVHSTTAYHQDNNRPNRIPEDADPWDSGNLESEGEEYSRRFDVPGVYDYYCRPHEYEGMLGSLIVGDPDPEDEPGLSSPTREFPSQVRQKLKTLNRVVIETLE